MKRLMSFLIIVALMAVVTGCEENKSTQAAGSEYTIYYSNGTGTGLESESFYTTSTDTDEFISQLYEQLQGKDNANMLNTIPKSVALLDASVSDRTLYMNFTENYVDMDDITEILLRAAVVKTMVQIPDIDYVVFYVNDQPLTGDTGVAVGIMDASSFVDDADDSLEAVTWTEATVYYSDSTGENLIGEILELAYNKNTPIEQVILEQLINGPDISQCKRSVPKNLKVLNVTTKEGVCYVNLDSSFLDSIVDVSSKVTLYSIVNSLCELNTINKVQILVNGSSDYTFRETYPLSDLYERNLDMVKDSYYSSSH